MPFALQLLHGERAGEVLPVLANSITIGRSSGEILLEDTEVSGKHCSVQMNSGELIIVDHASRNGTFLNGRRVERNRLRAGDTVQVGQISFRIVEWPTHPDFIDPLALVTDWCRQASIQDGTQSGQQISGLIEKEIELCLKDVQIRLMIESKDGRIVNHLVPVGEVILGRAGVVPLLAEDEEASRKHARLFVGEDGYLQAEDLGSANGTFLNEERLVGRRKMHASDTLRLGRTNVRASLMVAEFNSAIQL